MDKLVQEKNASIEAIPITTIPTVTIAVPYTSLALVATTIPVATIISTSATDSTTTTTNPSDEEGKLITWL